MKLPASKLKQKRKKLWSRKAEQMNTGYLDDNVIIPDRVKKWHRKKGVSKWNALKKKRRKKNPEYWQQKIQSKINVCILTQTLLFYTKDHILYWQKEKYMI